MTSPISRGSRSRLTAAASLTALAAVGPALAAGSPAHAAVGGGKSVDRVSGGDRYGTSIAASQSLWPNWSDTSDIQHAHAVVIARGDDFADALGGIPLASAKQGPLLVTPSSGLRQDVLQEVERVLKPSLSNTVYVLGGPGALSPSVDLTLEGQGYTVKRISGGDRYATSLAIAAELGNPQRVVLATGRNFPDALSAGPIASMGGVGRPGVILLSNDGVLPQAVADYIRPIVTTTTSGPDHFVVAIGGQAVNAVDAAIPADQRNNLTTAAGATRYDTSCDAAGVWFDTASPSAPVAVGIATGENFADALGGGAAIAQVPGPLLLTPPAGLPKCAADDITAVRADLHWVEIYGGTGVVFPSVENQLHQITGF